MAKDKNDSQSYENKKTLILANNAKYEQLKFMVRPEEKEAFKNKAKELGLTQIELFRLSQILIKDFKLPAGKKKNEKIK
jgi:hypothetical protein